MGPDANSMPADGDEARLRAISIELADAVEEVLPDWVEGLVARRVQQWRGEVDAHTAAAAAAAGESARTETMAELRVLLSTDVDEQRSNPLAVLRGATRHAHAVLAGAGVPPVVRDDFARRSFPDDAYDLVPATWADVDPSLHEIGITWGAAKAFVHRARRRAEGKT